MRTTLDIDDDVLLAIAEIAKRESKPLDAIVSSLLRQSLSGGNRMERTELPTVEFGFRPFPKRGGVVTDETIDRLREETGD